MTRLIDYCVRHPQLTVLGFVMAIVLGINAVATIPLAVDPTFPIPTFSVTAVYPGAAPADLEQTVVDPIEDAINALDDVKRIRTEIRDGLAVVVAEFEPQVDADARYGDVVREVNALQSTLPRDLARLEIQRFNASNVSIMQVALVSPTQPYRELERLARDLSDRLEQVDGVKGVERWAVPDREVLVDLDLDRLAAYRLSAGQVLAAIGSESSTVPGGTADAGVRMFTVKTSGSYRTLEQVRQTVVASVPSGTVRLADVGSVEWGHRDLTHLGRYNGQRAAFVTAQLKEGRRIGAVSEALERELTRYAERLPSGVVMERGFNQATNVARSLTRLLLDFGIAIALVAVTLLPLGGRAALIVMISIPLSLAIGVFALGTAGFTINQLSIVGFVIALGLLVDDSIVVVENIARLLRSGMSRLDAAVAATAQIAPAVLGCTAALIAAFIPLLFLPGNPGRFIRSMPMAVAVTIVASLIVSLTIVPLLASLLAREEKDPEGNRFMRGLNWAIDRTYASWLHHALGRPKSVLLAAGLLFLGSLALIPSIGFSLFPKADLPQFLVTIETGDGSSLGTTDRIARRVEATLRATPGVRGVFMNVGRGNPTVYYNVTARPEQINYAEAFVMLERFSGRATPRLLDSLQRQFDSIPNARIEVKAFENGPPVDAPVAVRLVGPDLDTLRGLAGRLQRLMDTTPGLRGIVNPLERRTSSLALAIDRGKAGVAGVPIIEIDRTVRMALAGAIAGSVRESDGNDYLIRVRLRPGSSTATSLDGSPAAGVLDRLSVASLTGQSIPLRHLARTRFESASPTIAHYNRERSVTVSANVRTGYNTDKVTQEVLVGLRSWQLPDGYRVIPAGEIESREESFGGLGTAIIVAIFLTLAILVLEFGSFRSSIVVASVIPLGVVGGLVALLISGNTLSFTAMVGFVALVGIEIKNSILLVDFTNQLRAEGVALDQAIERAGRVRFIPIVLTTLTAVGGLLPLALQGSSLYSPLAQVIIGGLLSSTLLARLVTPVVYQLLAPPVSRAPDRGLDPALNLA